MNKYTILLIFSISLNAFAICPEGEALTMLLFEKGKISTKAPSVITEAAKNFDEVKNSRRRSGILLTCGHIDKDDNYIKNGVTTFYPQPKISALQILNVYDNNQLVASTIRRGISGELIEYKHINNSDNYYYVYDNKLAKLYCIFPPSANFAISINGKKYFINKIYFSSNVGSSPYYSSNGIINNGYDVVMQSIHFDSSTEKGTESFVIKLYETVLVKDLCENIESKFAGVNFSEDDVFIHKIKR